MQKIISVFLIFIILLSTLSACGIKKPEIEDYEWEMQTIMHISDEQIVYDALAEESASHPEAKIIKMTLIAKDGEIRITDVTNGKTYEGTYTVSGRNPKGTDYHVTIADHAGYATVAMTEYADGTEKPTLPISLDRYSIYFYAK